MIELPIKTVAGQNAREHHMARARRAQQERAAACMSVRQWHRDGRSWVITVTRISAGTLDAHDNLPASLKNIVDGIADGFGLQDNDTRFTWRYAQEKCKRGQYGVRIQIEPGD